MHRRGKFEIHGPGRSSVTHPEVPARAERETASLLPVLVYFEGAVQLRNIHIPAGVSRLASQEGVGREARPAWAIKRKKRASRKAAFDAGRPVSHVNTYYMNVRVRARV